MGIPIELFETLVTSRVSCKETNGDTRCHKIAKVFIGGKVMCAECRKNYASKLKGKCFMCNKPTIYVHNLRGEQIPICPDCGKFCSVSGLRAMIGRRNKEGKKAAEQK